MMCIMIEFQLSGTWDFSGHSKYFHLKYDFAIRIGLNLVVINSKKLSENSLIKYIIFITITYPVFFSHALAYPWLLY